MISAAGFAYKKRVTILGYNRTGGTVTVGGVYSVDGTGSATESTTAQTNHENIVACATANLRQDKVVALSALADDALGEWLLKGVESVLVDGTTNVAEGDALVPQNASVNLIGQAAGSLVMPCGIALDAQATDAGTLTLVYFNGEDIWKGQKAAS
jgi:hypothetical protein